MNFFFYLGCMVLLFACMNQKESNSIIPVTLPAEDAEGISWFETFPDMEMICLTGENRQLPEQHRHFWKRPQRIS